MDASAYVTLWADSASAAVCARGDIAPDPLLEGEAALVARAVDVRRLEFSRGRSCARRALALLGVLTTPILRADQAPVWPAGTLGSITHCKGFVCAAVAHASACRALGIDAEVLQPIEVDVEEQVLSTAESARLANLDPTIPWACVAFSIKEAIYKAWHPRTGRWLDFHDADVVIDPDGKFSARVYPAAATPGAADLGEITGRFAFHGPHVLSVVQLVR